MDTRTLTIQAKANINKLSESFGISTMMFSSKVNIKRKTTSKSTTGDLSETFVINQYNIPVTIQPLTGVELTNLQGMVYNYTHKGFLPKAVRLIDNEIVYIAIREGDMLYDQETEISYRVRQVENVTPANINKNHLKYHHYELLLEKINDNRYDN